MIEIVDLRGGGKSQKLDKILKRFRLECRDELESVRQTLADVRANGDFALLRYTREFDGVTLTECELQVSENEIDEAYGMVAPELLESLRKAAYNIRQFHELQKREDIGSVSPGAMTGQRILPIRKAGLYVPGGRAAYPSSVLMNAIPAKVAGVGEIIMCTPPDKNNKVYYLTLVAAREAGVDRIYKAGGAQAIAAMAFGTQTIPRVDKIVGPGNIYVTLAKREVFGIVGIDMVAGPSEVLVVADRSANPRYIAADMLSQAEHDPLAAAILVTDSPEVAKKTAGEIELQLRDLPTAETARKSIDGFGAVLLTSDHKQSVEIANMIAPEHLELAVENPQTMLPEIVNAGAVFLGEYSPEPLGDYFAGPNHVLPTSGTARFSSPLGVDDFIKRSSVIYYGREALEKDSNDIIRLAESEGLYAHANSIKVRFEGDKQ